MKKLYFYKCAHFLLFLSFSTVIIHQFHSYSKIVTLIPLIPNLIPHIPIIPSLTPRIAIIPTLIPRIPIIPLVPFPDSPFRRLQIANWRDFLWENEISELCVQIIVAINFM